ncbi:hypothetical protein Dimus_004258 [Dionaea muscipula]
MKSARAVRVRDDMGASMNEAGNISFLERRLKLFQLASSIIDEAIVNEAATQVAENDFYLTQKKILDMKPSRDVGEESSIQVPVVHDYGVKEPLQVRAKGCGKRLKGGKEKAIKKARRCNGCGLIGQSHDKRNCPQLLNISSQSAWLNDADSDEDDDEVGNSDNNDCKCFIPYTFVYSPDGTY